MIWKDEYRNGLQTSPHSHQRWMDGWMHEWWVDGWTGGELGFTGLMDGVLVDD